VHDGGIVHDWVIVHDGGIVHACTMKIKCLPMGAAVQFSTLAPLWQTSAGRCPRGLPFGG